MTKFQSIFTKVIWGFVYLLPAVLFFSYYPIISLGSNDSMNFELSLPLIWLIVFDLLALMLLIRLGIDAKRRSFETNKSASTRVAQSGSPVRASADADRAKRPSPWIEISQRISDKRFFLFSLFPFFATLSIFWSANPVRAILTAGIIWLLFFAIFAIIYLLPLLPRPQNFTANLIKVFFGATTTICLWCFVQSILDACGFSRSGTLLCAGCTSASFGFPHPSGFAIEPQFMGNLLLVPTLLSLYLLIFASDHHPTITEDKNNIRLGLCAFLFSLTLFFTFSRGAIYAFAVALIVLLVFAFKRHQFRLSLILIPVVAFLCSLGLQGTFAEFGPTSETFLSAVTKSIHHLSLGKIDLRSIAKAPSASSEPSLAASNSIAPIDQAQAESSATEPQNASDKPFFDGYVAESTNVRLKLNEAALNVWHSAPTNLIFGVGLGGAGTAMYRASAINSPKEIVQNQFISILLELGLIGALLAIFSLLLAFFPQIFPQKFLDGRAAPAQPSPQVPVALLAPIVIAFLVSLNFFSGLPNALHIYLLPPLLYPAFAKPPSNPPKTQHKLANSTKQT